MGRLEVSSVSLLLARFPMRLLRPSARVSRLSTVLGAVLVLLSACTGEQPAQVDPNRMTAPMSADEVRAEMVRVQAVTPLPPGAGWFPVDLDPDATYGSYAGGSMVEFQALCAWLIAATHAAAQPDEAAYAAVVSVVEDIPRWRSFSDPTLSDAAFRIKVDSLAIDVSDRELRSVGAFIRANCG